MAKYTPGPLVGQMSGGIGCVVATRGRYGSVLRIGVMPTKRTTAFTVAQRGLLGALSKAWGALDDGERAAWNTWASMNPIIDSLGQSRVLAGNAAFIELNARILYVGGTQIDLPPVAAAPVPISGATLTCTTAGDAQVGWTSGALAAGCKLVVWAALINSAGRSYYKNLLKAVAVSAAAGATPFFHGPSVTTRFGKQIAGQILKEHLFVVDSATGLMSSVAIAQVTVS